MELDNLLDAADADTVVQPVAVGGEGVGDEYRRCTADYLLAVDAYVALGLAAVGAGGIDGIACQSVRRCRYRVGNVGMVDIGCRRPLVADGRGGLSLLVV